MSIATTRPHLHFTVQEGWINDPLGLTFHGGRYHLFFQFVPGRTQWGPRQCWGHATSDDLLHWTEEPVALAPGEGDDGVWSGSIAVPDEGPALLFYTTVSLDDVQIGKVRVARPADDTWMTWHKGDVVAELPPGVEVVAFRDPYVFHDGIAWRMLMGAGLTDGTATALTYRSDDLNHWVYDGLLASRHRRETEPLWTGVVWECPQIFRLGDRWVLTFSVWEPTVPHYEAYAIGDLVDGRFTAQTWGRLSYGPSYYAASAFVGQDADRGLIYWLRDVDDPAGRWASAHSVPHRLSLVGDRVVSEPPPTLVAARVGEPIVSFGGSVEIGWVSDLEWRLAGPRVQAVLVVAGAETGGEEFRLAASDGELTATVAAGSWTMPLNDRDVRVLIDGPIVEIFTTTGVMALPIPSEGPLRVVTLTGESQLTAHPLT